MLVEIIARKSQNIDWKISLNGNPFSDSRIRRVSIDKFYELVTGEKNSFKNLCEQLPIVIADIVNDINLDEKSNTVFYELEQISTNLLKSLYLLSFEKYDGFDNFNV
jgi:hypothetical protein